MRYIVTSFGVVVAGNSILPKNSVDLFIQIYICLFWILCRRKGTVSYGGENYFTVEFKSGTAWTYINKDNQVSPRYGGVLL